MPDDSPSSECPQCGGVIPPDALHGLCPRCVFGGLEEPTGAAAAGLPPMEEVAAAFPQLEILEWLGRGGMGMVCKARQRGLDRLVALKLLPVPLAGEAGFAERFNREARVLARLSHPNIVSVYDFGISGEFYWLLMEYVDGVNLRQAMEAGKFEAAEALRIVPKICEALQYAHDEGVLHRDIKPENILIDRRGRIKLVDFGIAKVTGRGDEVPGTERSSSPDVTHATRVLGTPAYMAPEQREAPASVDGRADVYSLGVVLYELLTGSMPGVPLRPPSAFSPVPSGVDAIVMRALQHRREKRQGSAREFGTQVETAAAVPPVPPRGSPVTGRSFGRWRPRGAGRARWSWLAVILGFWGAILLLSVGIHEGMVLAYGFDGKVAAPPDNPEYYTLRSAGAWLGMALAIWLCRQRLGEFAGRRRGVRALALAITGMAAWMLGPMLEWIRMEWIFAPMWGPPGTRPPVWMCLARGSVPLVVSTGFLAALIFCYRRVRNSVRERVALHLQAQIHANLIPESLLTAEVSGPRPGEAVTAIKWARRSFAIWTAAVALMVVFGINEIRKRGREDAARSAAAKRTSGEWVQAEIAADRQRNAEPAAAEAVPDNSMAVAEKRQKALTSLQWVPAEPFVFRTSYAAILMLLVPAAIGAAAYAWRAVRALRSMEPGLQASASAGLALPVFIIAGWLACFIVTVTVGGHPESLSIDIGPLLGAFAVPGILLRRLRRRLSGDGGYYPAAATVMPLASCPSLASAGRFLTAVVVPVSIAATMTWWVSVRSYSGWGARPAVRVGARMLKREGATITLRLWFAALPPAETVRITWRRRPVLGIPNIPAPAVTPVLREGDTRILWRQDGTGGALTGPLDLGLEFASEAEASAAARGFDTIDGFSDTGIQLYTPASSGAVAWRMDSSGPGLRIEVEGGRNGNLKSHP